MKQLTAIPIEHKDIRGNTLYYIKITNGKEEWIINVGIKTYAAVNDLQKEDKPKTEKPKP